jgi:hypothetical protein
MPQELDGATVYMMTRDAIKAKVGLAWHADKLKSMRLPRVGWPPNAGEIAAPVLYRDLPLLVI